MPEVLKKLSKRINRGEMKKKIDGMKWVNGQASIICGSTMSIKGKGFQKLELACRIIELFPEIMIKNQSEFMLYFNLRKLKYLTHTSNAGNGQEIGSVAKSLAQNCIDEGIMFPKMHFITHYGEMISYYGSLMRYSTEKYERKHAFLKDLILTSKNYVNVPQSIVKRHQALTPFVEDIKGIEEGVVGSLLASDRPFRLNRQIARAILHKYDEFLEADKFIRKDNKIVIGGKLWSITDERINIPKISELYSGTE